MRSDARSYLSNLGQHRETTKYHRYCSDTYPHTLSVTLHSFLTPSSNWVTSPRSGKQPKAFPYKNQKKNPTDVNSYRPISLLSVISKLLERIIASRLTTFINQNHILPDTQFGFRKNHSTVSQLARITDHTTHGYNLNKHTGMALLDLEKAYDTVWITGLLYKLIALKLPEYLLFVLRSYLEGRTYTVHIKTPNPLQYTPQLGFPKARYYPLPFSPSISLIFRTPRHPNGIVRRRYCHFSPILET